MKKILTVFTPTYNRAYCLHQVYDSLINQTCPDFEWMVIDDGSTDDTKALVNQWIEENKIVIRYIYQENQGMHGAHNTAYKNINTELNVCIDSDDFMPVNAVETILENAKQLLPTDAGMLGLDANREGVIIGKKFDENLQRTNHTKYYQIEGGRGDKKFVYRTEIIKKYPLYPIFPNERFVPLDILYQLIDQDYNVMAVNETWCNVEYQPDGSSRNILKQYRRHPNGFAYARLINIKYALTFKNRFRSCIHLVADALYAKRIHWLLKCSHPFVLILAFPPGLILYTYIYFKTFRSWR
jgi:glycosyltransferase involved in cell wall biosynthesis